MGQKISRRHQGSEKRHRLPGKTLAEDKGREPKGDRFDFRKNRATSGHWMEVLSWDDPPGSPQYYFCPDRTPTNSPTGRARSNSLPNWEPPSSPGPSWSEDSHPRCYAEPWPPTTTVSPGDPDGELLRGTETSVAGYYQQSVEKLRDKDKSQEVTDQHGQGHPSRIGIPGQNGSRKGRNKYPLGRFHRQGSVQGLYVQPGKGHQCNDGLSGVSGETARDHGRVLHHTEEKQWRFTGSGGEDICLSYGPGVPTHPCSERTGGEGTREQEGRSLNSLNEKTTTFPMASKEKMNIAPFFKQIPEKAQSNLYAMFQKTPYQEQLSNIYDTLISKTLRPQVSCIEFTLTFAPDPDSIVKKWECFLPTPNDISAILDCLTPSNQIMAQIFKTFYRERIVSSPAMGMALICNNSLLDPQYIHASILYEGKDGTCVSPVEAQQDHTSVPILTDLENDQKTIRVWVQYLATRTYGIVPWERASSHFSMLKGHHDRGFKKEEKGIRRQLSVVLPRTWEYSKAEGLQQL